MPTSGSQTQIIRLQALGPPRGSVIAFVDTRMPSHMELYGCTLHRLGDRCWINPPSMRRLGKDGQPVIGDNGWAICDPIIGNHGLRARWSRGILAAIRRQHSEVALPDEGAP